MPPTNDPPESEREGERERVSRIKQPGVDLEGRNYLRAINESTRSSFAENGNFAGQRECVLSSFQAESRSRSAETAADRENPSMSSPPFIH